MPVTPAEMDAIAIKAAEQVWQRWKIAGPGGELLTLQATLQHLLAATPPAASTSAAPIDVAALVKAINDDAAKRMAV